MNASAEAAWQAHTFFTEQGIPYAIIGGIAVQYWGEPRFTQDIVVTNLLNMAPLRLTPFMNS